jgi:hypothetical protein
VPRLADPRELAARSMFGLREPLYALLRWPLERLPVAVRSGRGGPAAARSRC